MQIHLMLAVALLSSFVLVTACAEKTGDSGAHKTAPVVAKIRDGRNFGGGNH
jgi:hypothetical protein